MEALTRRIILTAAALLTLLIIGPSARQTEAFQQIPPIQFSKHALLNGFELYFLPADGEKAFFVLMIKNGAAFDPSGKWGVTELMARLMLERTERRAAAELKQDLDAVGADLQVRIGWDALFFHGSVPAARAEDALNILAEIVIRPDFRQEDFERLRSRQMERVGELAGRRENATQWVFQKEIFQDHPYAHPVEGTLETLGAIQLNDVRIQYRRLIMPNQAKLAISYPGEALPLFQKLGRSWGPWVRGEPAPFTFRRAEPLSRNRVLVVGDTAEGSLLRLGALGVSQGNPDFYALKIFEKYVTLSLTDWAGRVTDRSQIQASVRLQARVMPGFFQISVQAPIGELGGYVGQFKQLLANLQTEGPDPNRLVEAKELAFLELRHQLSDARDRLFALLEANLHGLGISYLANYGLRLERVKPLKFKETIERFFPGQNCLLVVAGDSALLSSQMEPWGAVEILN